MTRPSLLVAITFHYDDRRLRYLYEVIRSLTEFQHGADVDVVVCTNLASTPRLDRLVSLIGSSTRANFQLEVARFSNLEHPFHLTWAHRSLVRDRFRCGDAKYTHFVYLEDDIRFTASNFRYFLAGRPVLREFGLIPSFVRVEFNQDKGFLFCSDVTGHALDFPACAKLVLDGQIFVSWRTPYCGIYVLDAELGDELVNSPMQTLEGSLSVFPLDPVLVRERAASALCWYNVPPGYASRYVVPVAEGSLIPPMHAWVEHLPATYTNHPFEEGVLVRRWGEAAVDQIFAAHDGAVS